MIINIFMASAQLMWLISIAGVVIFSILIAFDTQRIREDYLEYGDSQNSAVQGALALYLDFLNLFLFLLQILGYAKSE